MDLAMVRKVLTGGASIVAVVLLVWATVHAQVTPNTNSPKMAVLHATVTITGGLAFTGSYDDRLQVRTCADVARGGTARVRRRGRCDVRCAAATAQSRRQCGSVGGGHTFSTDVAAWPYHGPGTYTGSGLTATQMDVDTPLGSQDTHIFAFPTGVGTLIVNPDASGSFRFEGLQDPGSITISGQIIWTCS